MMICSVSGETRFGERCIRQSCRNVKSNVTSLHSQNIARNPKSSNFIFMFGKHILILTTKRNRKIFLPLLLIGWTVAGHLRHVNWLGTPIRSSSGWLQTLSVTPSSSHFCFLPSMFLSSLGYMSRWAWLGRQSCLTEATSSLLTSQLYFIKLYLPQRRACLTATGVGVPRSMYQMLN